MDTRNRFAAWQGGFLMPGRRGKYTCKMRRHLCFAIRYDILCTVVKRTRTVHPAFDTKEGGDAMSVSDAVSLIGCVMSLISLLISVYLLGRR